MFGKILVTASLAAFLFSGCVYKDEVTIVNEKGKYGSLESNGDVIIKPIFDEASEFDDIKNKNIKASHPHLVNLHWLHDYRGNEFTIVEYKKKYGIVTREGEMVVKPIYDTISRLFNGFFVIEVDDKFGYMNDEFEVVQKPIFKDAREFLDMASFVQSNANSKWGCITNDMELKINDKYDEVYNFYEGFARTFKDGKWGYINNSCEEVVAPIYDYAFDFSKGFAKVVYNGHDAYINSKGENITKNIFTRGENF